jgi:hypothetical protein
VAEKNGTRTKLMELQAALVDHAVGRPLVDPAGFVQQLRETFDIEPYDAPVNGFEPLD